MEIGDVTVVDGTVGDMKDAVILDAATASRAIDDGCLDELVDTALRSLVLTGKSVVYVKQEER